MSDAEALLAVLRQSADADAVAAIEQLVRAGTDRALNRINVIDFAAKNGLSEENALGAFLHASRLGIFDLSWKDRKSTRLNSSHQIISYAVFCLKKKKKYTNEQMISRDT